MKASGWLRVSLQVDGELAEAVADVLARFAPGGVVVEQAASPERLVEESWSSGPVSVYAFIPKEAATEDTRRRLLEALYFLGRIHPLPEPEIEDIPEQDWTQTWKENFRPIRIGARLLVLPPWISPEPTDRAVVRIDPGMAFGTGTHPSTQLCLEILDELGSVPAMVFDVGCGSGILAISSLKLGGRNALGVDTDPQAIEAAAKNARLNAVAKRLILGVGSVAEIMRGEFGARSAPLVVANILAPVLVRLLESGLTRLVQPDGRLVLSGMLLSQKEEVRAAVLANGLKVREWRSLGDWTALIAG